MPKILVIREGGKEKVIKRRQVVYAIFWATGSLLSL